MAEDFSKQIVHQFGTRLGREYDRRNDDVRSDEVVERQESEAYQLSDVLKQIISPHDQVEIAESLEQLRLLNNSFEGQRVVIAEADLELSGEHRPLAARIWKWLEQHVETRIKKHSPRDKGCPVRQLLRLRDELFDQIAIPYFDRKHTIGYILFEPLRNRISHVLFTRLLSNYVSIRPSGLYPNLVAIRQSRINETDLASCAKHFAEKHGWYLDFLPTFFDEVRKAFSDETRSEMTGVVSRDSLIQNMNDLAADVIDMRCFVGGSNPGNLRLAIGKLVVGLKWTTRDGILELHVGQSDEEMMRSVFLDFVQRGIDGSPKVNIGYDGLITDCYRPWHSSETAGDDSDWLHLNLLLLDRIHSRLFASYERIDFDKLREKARSGSVLPDEEDQALAVAAHDLECREINPVASSSMSITVDSDAAPAHLTAPKQRAPLLRPIRMQTLLKWLTTQFNCQVTQGKGSEVNVFRPGGRTDTLAHHKRNPEIHVVRLKTLLRKLGINAREFFGMVYS